VVWSQRTRDRSVLVGKLAEILRDTRPARQVAASSTWCSRAYPD
jgi:hypothetical protein